MLKSCTFFRKLDNLSRAEAAEHWHRNHAELVRKVPGVRRYIQCEPRAEADHGFPFDGFAEFYTDDLAALKELGQTPEFADVTADEANFIAMEKTVLLLTDEFEFVSGDRHAPGSLKAASLWKRGNGTSPEDFRSSWLSLPADRLGRAGLWKRSLSFPRISAYNGGREVAYDALVCDWHVEGAPPPDYEIPAPAATAVPAGGPVVVEEFVIIQNKTATYTGGAA